VRVSECGGRMCGFGRPRCAGGVLCCRGGVLRFAPPVGEREFLGRMGDLCEWCSLTAVTGSSHGGGGVRVGGLREVVASFVVPGPAGVAVRDRLRVSEADAAVLAEVGVFLGSLAAGDLAERSRQGLAHGAASWAVRKRSLTGRSSARWAGSITKASHDQWALARRGQAAHMTWLRGQIAVVEARLARPLGAKADKRAGLVRGYASRGEWHAKSRRLHTLKDRLARVEADWAAGRVRVVRGGKRLAHTRHHLAAAGLDEAKWRQRWRAERMFLAADGESGKRFGNETIRVTDTGQVSLKLPAPLAHLANAPHGRYLLEATVRFQHRGEEWRDRITANRAVAYRIHHDPVRGRWYVTASWQRAAAPVCRWRRRWRGVWWEWT
jgi:hypothetical protein